MIWRIVVERGPNRGKAFRLKGEGSLSIGRSSKNGITLEDDLVSRLHCRLALEGEQLILQDCGSHNGTRVNHKNITQKPLDSGDLITVGESDLSVYLNPGPDPLLEKSIAGYTFLERIGRGSGGTVYRGNQQALDRVVALKVLPDDLVEDPKVLERFVSEARLAAGLQHPRLVAVHDIVQEKEICFYSMEFMAGGSLGDRALSEKTLPPEEVSPYLLQVAEGLKCLHDNGLIHRDIKPANLMLDDKGAVHIGDFGIANHGQGSSRSTISGSPHFMSPEQARGLELDARSDLYSLGCTAFRLLSGMPPFVGATVEAVLVSHIRDKPPKFKNACPSINPKLAKLLDRLLEKDPKDRYESAAAFRDQLKKAVSRPK